MNMVTVDSVSTNFGDNLIHDNISFTVRQGEIYGVLGSSGSGKSTILREMIMLESIQSGKIYILNNDIENISITQQNKLKQNWGVLFQFGALFSSLTVIENISVMLKEYTQLSSSLITDIAYTKLTMVGLPISSGKLYPSELSGGMKKRVGLARALSMDPEMLFLDEPTSGLDPASAESFDKLIVTLRDMLNLTVVIVTHDLSTIKKALDKFVIFYNKKVLYEGSYADAILLQNNEINKFLKL